MKIIRLKAYAKVNLGLDVIKKREDGYHEVRMIMQTIDIFDRLELRKTHRQGIFIQTNLSFLPTNQDNLVYKAARLIMSTYKLQGGIEIYLKKYIPVAAGMAGGSADAAAVLYGMNKLYDLRLSCEKLKELGLKLGADVPFCLMRGTALAEGIGDRLTAIKAAPDCKILVAKPNFGVSTKWVYGNLRADEIREHPDIDGLIKAIEDNDLRTMASLMGNVLETVTEAEYPQISELKQIMKNAGALNALMSGSGPTVFGLFENRENAEAAFKEIKSKQLARQVYITHMLNKEKRCNGQKYFTH